VERVLYIVGTGFTGSTLLAFLLNGHPRIATVGEATGPYELWDDQCSYVCSCGATLASCRFWQRVGQEMEQRGFRFGPNRWDLRFRVARGRLGHQLLSQSLRHNGLDRLRDELVLRVPPWRRGLRETARRNVAFVESVLAVTGARVFVDASKDPVRARYLLQLTELDLGVIHLVRDSPGFVSSELKNRATSLGPAVRRWKRMAGHARRLESLLPPDRFLRVHYEDVCTRTEAELARVARFAGLEPSPGPVDLRATEHHIIGNRMRLESSREIVLNEVWRERLSSAEVEEVRRRTESVRRRLGYA
jgi:hypothetical protein